MWLAGIASLLTMLAVLAIPADAITALSVGLPSSQWLAVSWLLLIVAVSMMGITWLIRRIQLAKHIATHSNSAPSSNPITQASPLNRVLKLVWLGFVLLAILTNGMAQRVAISEASLAQTVYVEATVTPIGLSDKVWREPVNPDADPPVYRQLVTLTDIRPFTELNQATNKVEVDKNPLAGGSNPSDVVQPFQNAQAPAQQPLPSNVNLPTALPNELTVLLKSYRSDDAWLNGLSPASQTTLRLALHPVIDEPTASGFNEYHWLTTRHATATAQPLKLDNATPSPITTLDNPTFRQRIDGLRFVLRQHFLNRLQTDNDLSVTAQSGQAVTLSLLTGDRSLIDKDTTALYRFAGISHLLAISGTHVLFLAILLANLVVFLVTRFRPTFFRLLSRWEVRLWTAVSVAFLYALFAGFDVPAVRTAMMLLAVGSVRYLLIDVPVLKVLLGLAIIMAWQDIFVLWQAGFWLSFVAVALLMVYGLHYEANGQNGRRNDISLNQFPQTQLRDRLQNQTEFDRLSDDPSIALEFGYWAKRTFWQFFKLQRWITHALFPITIWLFGKLSLWGIGINLFAIGLFGWVIVPLNLLAGVVYPLSTTLADGIWSLVSGILTSFHGLLFDWQASANYTGWLHADISAGVLVLIGLASMPLLLPKGMISQTFSVPMLILAVGAWWLMPTVQTTDNSVLSSDNAAVLPTASPSSTPQTLNPISLNTASSQVTAVLISTPKPSPEGVLATLKSRLSGDTYEHWVLLSYYPKQRFGKDVPDVSSYFNTAQGERVIEAMLDELSRHDVDKLAGVIGQTPTLALTELVGEMNKAIPIHQYWQAGWDNTKPSNQNVTLTPQPCTAGKSWQSYATSLQVRIVTGWQDISDKRVQGCTVQIENSELNSKQIFYASNQPMLADLWSLMCIDDDVQGLGFDNFHADKLWLNPQAKPSQALIQTLAPQSIAVLPHATATPSTEVLTVTQHSK